MHSQQMVNGLQVEVPHTVDTALSPVDDVLPLLAHVHTYHVRTKCTYASNTMSQHFGAKTKKNVAMIGLYPCTN